MNRDEYVPLNERSENPCILFPFLQLNPKLKNVWDPALHVILVVDGAAGDIPLEKGSDIRLVVGALAAVALIQPVVQMREHQEISGLAGLIGVRDGDKPLKGLRRFVLL